MLESGVRNFVEVRSYSEPRRVSLSEEEPEAYVEWGGPSQFQIEEPPAPGRYVPPGKRLRFDHRQSVLSSNFSTGKSLTTYELMSYYQESENQANDLLLFHQSFVRALFWNSVVFHSPYGGDIVFHFDNSASAIRPNLEEGSGIYPPVDSNGNPIERLEDIG